MLLSGWIRHVKEVSTIPAMCVSVTQIGACTGISVSVTQIDVCTRECVSVTQIGVCTGTTEGGSERTASPSEAYYASEVRSD